MLAPSFDVFLTMALQMADRFSAGDQNAHCLLMWLKRRVARGTCSGGRRNDKESCCATDAAHGRSEDEQADGWTALVTRSTMRRTVCKAGRLFLLEIEPRAVADRSIISPTSRARSRNEARVAGRKVAGELVASWLSIRPVIEWLLSHHRSTLDTGRIFTRGHA